MDDCTNIVTMTDHSDSYTYRARLQQKLKQQTIINDDTGCWIWKGQLANSGHGKLKTQVEGVVKVVSAEHASHIAFLGEVPTRHLVKQGCGNRLCVNPEHLELLEI